MPTELSGTDNNDYDGIAIRNFLHSKSSLASEAAMRLGWGQTIPPVQFNNEDEV